MATPSRWLFVLSIAWFYGMIGVVLSGLLLSHWTHHILQVVEGGLRVIFNSKETSHAAVAHHLSTTWASKLCSVVADVKSMCVAG